MPSSLPADNAGESDSSLTTSTVVGLHAIGGRMDSSIGGGEITASDLHLAAIAERSVKRELFLQNVAEQALADFDADIVCVTWSDDKAPLRIVANQSLADAIGDSIIRSLHCSATSNPTANNIAIQSGLSVSESDRSRGTATVDALTALLVDGDEKTALVVIYSGRQFADSSHKLAQLEKLQDYRSYCSRVLSRRPIDGTESIDSDTKRGVISRTGLTLFHRSLDLDSTAYAIANQSRLMLGCDRSTVLIGRPSGWGGRSQYRVAAVSGVAVVDRRSNAVRAVEKLVRAAVVLGRPIEAPCGADLPPQVLQPLDDYLDQSAVHSATIFPLYASKATGSGADFDDSAIRGIGDPMAVLLLENFSGPETINSQSVGMVETSRELVANEAAVALQNSIRHRGIVGRRLFGMIGRIVSGAHRWLYLATFISIFAVLFAMTSIQTQHYVVASGSIVPVIRREVFAQVDGVIHRILIVDGQRVVNGDALFEIDNPDLQSRSEVLTGKIQTATQRLAALSSTRLSSGSDFSSESKLAVEQRQIESELVDLNSQLQLVQLELEKLTVRSPIDGVIAGWQLRRKLLGRPVSRGNALVSVFDPTGAWQLRLEVDDRDAGPLLDRWQTGESPSVNFAVATDPKRTYAARLSHLASAARTSAEGNNTIEAIADVIAEPGQAGLSNFDPRRMRTQADVTAKLACGRRSIAASWFADVIDFYHRHLAFYL